MYGGLRFKRRKRRQYGAPGGRIRGPQRGELGPLEGTGEAVWGPQRDNLGPQNGGLGPFDGTVKAVWAPDE